jgi:hypothetical protein
MQIKPKTNRNVNLTIHVNLIIPIGIKMTESGLKTLFAITVAKKVISNLTAVYYCKIVAIIIIIIVIITIISATKILTTIVEGVELSASLLHEEDK